MQHALRRTAVILASSAVVLSGAPLLGTAFAASTLTQSSVTPTSSPAVQNSHPTISASYTDGGTAANLDPSSTITVTGGPTTVACDNNGTVSGNTITCNYAGLLKAGTYTITTHAVEASNTANTADNTSNFTVDVPTRVATNTAPGENSRVQSFSNVVVNFNKAIDDQHSKISVQQIADKQPDGSYLPANHTPLTPASGSPDYPNDGSTLSKQPNNTATEIRFTPSSAPVSKGIYRVTVDVFGTNPSSQPQTTAATENPNAETQDSYTFTMDDPLPPPPAPPGATNLAVSPTPVTKANVTSVTFSGNAVPGNTITVDATDGSSHVNNAGSSNGGPLTVTNASCASSTSCAWSKTLDLTTLSDSATINWTATETAPQNSTSYTGSTVKSGPSFVKDTTAPAGAHVAGSFSSPTSSTLHVVGGSDATVDKYKLDITDSSSPAHSIPQITLSKTNGDINADGTFAKDVDVSSLDDGTIHLSLVAIDQYGNAASAATGTATKAVGLLLDFNNSYFKQVNSDAPSFPDVLSRPNHAVQKPAQIVVKFSNSVTLTRHDNGSLQPLADSQAPAPYFVDNYGNGNTLNGTDAMDASDPTNRTVVVTPPAGFSEGGYTLHLTVYKGNGVCDINSDPKQLGGNGDTSYPSCPSYNDWVKVPGTATPFTFTVDTTPPAAPTIGTIPQGTIDGSNVGKVEIDVTGEPGSTVALTA
ncbi:MAG: hypothetical protein JO079_12815, partial [Frankiaceae bacterium]|nr:hypothetical protein [Frankiaceae bacterium]